MEKKIWSKPEMNEFAFAANEYVAACGDSGTVYKFTCDAGGGVGGYVWAEDNGTDGLQSGKDEWGAPSDGRWGSNKKDDYLGGYHACGTTHEAESTDSFLNGYYLAYSNWNNGNFKPSDVIKVIIWRGPWGNNIHCTENLNMKTWETAKS